jgi:hypothetical protein
MSKELVKKAVDALVRNKPKTANRHIDSVLKEKVKTALLKKKSELANKLIKNK